ncbi:hypothetical protein [Marinobacter fonticola]|nr:hypothetical protein [Marinobacter fonticola]
MQKNLPPNDIFQDYVKRMESRPAAKKANQIDDELAERISGAIA